MDPTSHPDPRGDQIGDLLTLNVDELGELRSPVMLVGLHGWFDIASAATDALEWITPTPTALTIGEIDPDPFFDFTAERPETNFDRDGRRRIDWPSTEIRLVRYANHDIVVVIGVEPHLHWRTFSRALTEVVRRLGCQIVVTVGAAADAVPHTRTPPVVGSTTDPDLARRLGLAAPSYQGVTGLIGTLLVDLDTAGIPAVSMRVAVPHYVANREHPRAVAALVSHLAHVLDVPFLADLTEDIEEADQLHGEMVEQDEALQMLVRMLEAQYDQHAEAQIPSPDELGRQLEEFLREQDDDS